MSDVTYTSVSARINGATSLRLGRSCEKHAGILMNKSELIRSMVELVYEQWGEETEKLIVNKVLENRRKELERKYGLPKGVNISVGTP